MANILTIIPARMASSRFPGKPMANILGKPMIGHVYERVSKSPLVSITVVATCDKEIYNYIWSIGGRAVMTASTYERASDRCGEALLKLEAETGKPYDIVVMVQGDEPMTHPEMLSEALQPMLDNSALKVVNLLGKVENKQEFEDRNCIKVVCDMDGYAMYFSREPIPTKGASLRASMGKQVCVIPFRRDFLLEYTKLEPTPLEVAESIDMLRVLEHGIKVKMIPTCYKTYAVDTPEDLIKVESMMRVIAAENAL